MRKMTNSVEVSGVIYDHKLEMRETGPTSQNPGTPYIRGSINIATDDSMMNVIPVYYTYVTATTAKGNANRTYSFLKSVIDGDIKTVMSSDADHAAKVKITGAIELNEFPARDTGEMISQKRVRGSFINNVTELEPESQRSTFKTDMVITGCSRIDANEERNTPEKVIVKGYIFDFRNVVMPVEFTALKEGAMDYFMDLGASGNNPVFTCVWGEQVSQTIERTVTEESAFGEPTVKIIKSSHKDFVITGANPELYEFDSPETIEAKELADALAAREVYLADIKQRANNVASAPKTASPSGKTYNF